MKVKYFFINITIEKDWSIFGCPYYNDNYNANNPTQIKTLDVGVDDTDAST